MHGIAKQFWCINCKATRKPVACVNATTASGSAVRFEAERKYCCACGAQLIEYTVEKLATLLWEQMKLLDEGKAIAEEARRLRQEVERLKHNPRYYHPPTNTIIDESETAAAGIIGRVRMGWDGKVYRLDPAGLSELVSWAREQGRQQVNTLNNNERLELLDLRRKVADLQREIERLQRRPEPGSRRGRREIEY